MVSFRQAIRDGLIADAEILNPETNIEQSIAYPMSRVPAVWRYAGRAVRAAGNRLVSLKVFRDPAGLTMGCGGPAAGDHFFRSVLVAVGC